MSRPSADKEANNTSSSSNASRPPNRRGASGAWNRLKPTPNDPLDVYGLPSKGETRLNDPKAQENYYTHIVERYMKFCAASAAHGGQGLERAFSAITITGPGLNLTSSVRDNDGTNARPALPRHHTPTSEREHDLPNILLAMRKLREGILSSRRRDTFAQRAYIFIIHATLLTRTWEAYQPALLYLLDVIHPYTPLSAPKVQEFAGIRVLDLACRQHELREAYAVKRRFKVRDRKVEAVLAALVHDDWVRFWRVRRAVDGYQRAVMEFAVEGMRVHALKCLGRSYMSADRMFVERSADASWEELVRSGVGWALQETGSVVIRKPKSK